MSGRKILKAKKIMKSNIDEATVAKFLKVELHENSESNIDVNKLAGEVECENCKKCICKEMRQYVNSDILHFYEMHTRMLQNLLGQPSQAKVGDVQIELLPGSGISLPESRLKYMESISNHNHRTLVRLLLTELINEHELLECRTAEGLNNKNPTIQMAIITYLNKMFKCTLSTTEFNDIVNKKLRSMKQTPDEIAKAREEGRKRAALSRSKTRAKIKSKLDDKEIKISEVSPTVEISSSASSSTVEIQNQHSIDNFFLTSLF